MKKTKAIIIANWKMNLSLSAVPIYFEQFFSGITKKDLNDIQCIICPSYPFLPIVHQLCQGNSCWVGAQNVSEHTYGAYTGEVSSDMLKDVGCEYVLIGHSERRHLYYESDESISYKVTQALEAGLIPIVCVGETQKEREQGLTKNVLHTQVLSILENCAPEFYSRLIFAYEPVWAIGSGVTPDITEIESIHSMIVTWLRNDIPEEDIRVLYGGSLNANNANKILALPNVFGGLIGGASLLVEEFVKICKIGASL